MATNHSPSSACTDGIAYAVHGQGEPVILIHGVGLHQGVWAAQVQDLARDHQVITYDTLGHGDSALPPEEACLQEYADQMLSLMQRLRLPAANVIGHSMGALIALEFALSYPARTRRVAALNAVFMRTPEQRRTVLQRAEVLSTAQAHPAVAPTIARWFGDPVPRELVESAQLVRDAFGRLDLVGYARAYRVFASSDRAHAARLPQLTIPALFMTGELDPNSTPAMSRAMAELVPGALLEIVEGAGHMSNMTHAPRVNRVLRDFLLSHVAAAGAERRP